MKHRHFAKRCPFCENPHEADHWEPGPGLYAVLCGNPLCVAAGPVRQSLSEAYEAWNAAHRREIVLGRAA